MSYPVATTEQARQAALTSYHLLGSQPEQEYQDFVRLAAHICGTPHALITLIDADYQHYFASLGLEGRGTPREEAFCAHTILGTELFTVSDARADERFASFPSVAQGPQLRFYAGAPLLSPDGLAIGSLCVLDSVPRTLDAAQGAALMALARSVMAHFDLRRVSAELADALEQVRQLQSLLPICSYCKDVRNDKGYWNSLEHYLATQTDLRLSHGICPDCLKENFPEVWNEMYGEAGPADTAQT